MATNPNTPNPNLLPEAGQPKKPIEKRTLGLLVVALLVVAGTLTTLVSFLGTSAPKAQPGEVQAPTAKNTVAGFSDDVNRAKEVIVKNSESASRVASVAAALHASLPPCDDAMRKQLHGEYYVLRSNSVDVPDANLVCQPDNQWAVLPPTVGQAPPVTEAQRAAESHSTATGVLSPAEKHKLRLQAAYQSSPIPLHFADAPAHTADSAAAESVASVPPAAQAAAVPAFPAPVPAAVAPPKHEQLGVQLSNYRGPRYPVFQGRIIEGLLANRVMGEQGGPVKVQVTTPVYSQDSQHLLIPPGSILLGEASRVDAAGQARLVVVFHRIIMPDGWSFLLEPTHGLDQQGAGGLTGKVDRHLLALISTAVMVGAIEGLADVTSVGSGSAVIEVQSGLSREGSNEGMQILRNSLNRPPSITVYEGTRVRVWVAQDQALPEYGNHIVKTTVE
jgi:type IV secretion system protein VirB10